MVGFRSSYNRYLVIYLPPSRLPHRCGEVKTKPSRIFLAQWDSTPTSPREKPCRLNLAHRHTPCLLPSKHLPAHAGYVFNCHLGHYTNGATVFSNNTTKISKIFQSTKSFLNFFKTIIGWVRVHQASTDCWVHPLSPLWIHRIIICIYDGFSILWWRDSNPHARLSLLPLITHGFSFGLADISLTG